MQYVYSFKEGMTDKAIVGGKGEGLAQMTKIGIPVPPGFTITTQVCDYFYKNGNKYPAEMTTQIDEKLALLEKEIGKKLGDASDPLLVSVRSGAAVSMPGMMDTILNLGLNDKSVEGLSAKTNNPRFAWDSYRRFMQMFGNVVMQIEHHKFEHVIEGIKETRGIKLDTEMTVEDLKKVVEGYKKVVAGEKKSFPQDPKEQLSMAVNAVFSSWNNNRAITYRQLNHITGLLGTAVNVQAMVFGNKGDSSCTGVCFSRNPSTGENKFYGEFLVNAQGEDVVAGIRTPMPIEQMGKIMPETYAQLLKIRETLEHHYKDMQDMEFTVEDNRLFMLQTRNGKRTAAAACKVAIDLLNEKIIDEKTAVLRVDPSSINQLLHKQLDPVAKKKAELLAKGLPASPGAAVGEIVFSAERAVEKTKEGCQVVLCREETSPEDIMGMNVAQGILTSRGGMTSHAAVVARGMGKCCVAGCGDAKITEDKMVVGGQTFKEGDFISLDGAEGEVFKGKMPTVDPKLSGDFAAIMKLADKYRTLGVRANADIPRDAEKAFEFGAEGIGLCRTEHMFFEGERIKAMREMIVADNLEARKKALAKLLPYQKSDFMGLFKTMKGKPVTVRLLDPPLHEFLPKEEEDIKALAKEMKITEEKLRNIISNLHEVNPMLGHRGCRLGITYPEITEMQSRAIFEAAKEVGGDVVPEVMIPLVGNIKELLHQKAIIVKVAEELGVKKYKVGTMIEVPRAALIAEELAKEAEFFSFGTNDLTQMTLGYSRDDVGKFVPDYLAKEILARDPFATLDQDGVGLLVKMAVEKGKKVRPDIKLGICGEHGGDPASIAFCHKAGLNYVSCSPYRVPIARLAAAHAALKQ